MSARDTRRPGRGRGGAARYHFFAGKGGVGKTTCAAAAALRAADRGERVLVVSTDPAHSLGDALGRPLGPRATRVPLPAPRSRRGVLEAVQLDADRALERWVRDRRRALVTIAERGTYLDTEDIERFLRLSLPGVDELVGLIELTRLGRAAPRDLVVVDTAPTGHTLRLLAMPATLRRIASVLADMQAKHRFLAESLGGGYRRDATDALVDELDREGRALADMLRDPGRCAFSWILIAEVLALAEACDGVGALESAGIAVQEIVVNAVTPAAVRCATCAARIRAETEVIAAVRAQFSGRCLRMVPALPREPQGPAALRRVGRALAAARPARALTGPSRRPIAPRVREPAPSGRAGGWTAPPWLSVLAPSSRTLLLVGGKGGVGKTTCATTASLALAARDPARRVLLLSTDPAHSLGDVLDLEVGDRARRVPGAPGQLFVRELDAERAFAVRRERYRDAVDELFNALLGGSRFDIAYDRAVVRQLIDLAPPGLDELFAVLTVIDALQPAPAGGRAPYDTVVVDTAPTGHALRLLQMPASALDWVHALLAILLKYRKVIGLGELAADLVAVARDLRELHALLRDPVRAGFVAVTRAAELPRLETERLLERLDALAIDVPALVVNRVVSPAACPRCRAAAAAEAAVIARLSRDRPEGCAMIVAPALPAPPRGADALGRWGSTWTITDP